MAALILYTFLCFALAASALLFDSPFIVWILVFVHIMGSFLFPWNKTYKHYVVGIAANFTSMFLSLIVSGIIWYASSAFLTVLLFLVMIGAPTLILMPKGGVMALIWIPISILLAIPGHHLLSLGGRFYENPLLGMICLSPLLLLYAIIGYAITVNNSP